MIGRGLWWGVSKYRIVLKIINVRTQVSTVIGLRRGRGRELRKISF